MRFPLNLSKILLVLCILFLVPIVVSMPKQVLSQSIPAQFDVALKASKEGDFAFAIKIWDQIVEEFPEDAAAWSNRGNVRLALGDPEGAIADQNVAIELLPDELDSYLNRGIAHQVLHHYIEAEKDYQFILNHDSENSSALYNLGNIRSSEGDWSQAKMLYEKATIVNPSFAIARSSNALASYQLGDIEKAEFELRNLIRKYPMFADARAALTALLWRKGISGEAESNWNAAFGLDDRYCNKDWLADIRNWPPKPTNDLMNFLSLKRS